MSSEMITLVATGLRERVNDEQALAMIKEWESQLTDKNVVVNRVVLTDKSYSESAATLISNFLKPHVKHVTIVDLSDVFAGRPEVEALAVMKILCDTFRDCNLVEVNLSENAMGLKGISVCESVLNKQTKTLEVLYLENMGLAKESVAELADILTAVDVETGTCACDNLRVLHFYNNMIGNEGAVTFQRILGACSKLEGLRYSMCRATTEGSQALGAGLDQLGDKIASLRKLDLSGSCFGQGEDESDGVHALVRALQRATGLTHVNLRDYGLEQGGTEMVVMALKQAKAPIVELDISENEAGPEAAQAVAELLLEVMGTLEVFKSEGNELTSVGVKCLVEAISSESSNLRELQLDLNECGHIGARALCNAILPNLETLHLDGNMFPADDVKALETVFGEKLQEMEDNDEDEDVDADFAEDEEVVDELAAAMSKTQV